MSRRLYEVVNVTTETPISEHDLFLDALEAADHLNDIYHVSDFKVRSIKVCPICGQIECRRGVKSESVCKSI